MTFRSRFIWLFAPVAGRAKGVSLYLLLTPGSIDYGSVLVELVLQREKTQDQDTPADRSRTPVGGVKYDRTPREIPIHSFLSPPISNFEG